jgi:tetratricopeptide (TPR) repeat protein
MPALSSAQAEFVRAVDSHRRGQLNDAERLCRSVLRTEPRHFGASYMLGVIALQRGNLPAALAEMDRAIQLDPNSAAAHRDRGVVLARLERFADALASLERAIALKSDNAEAFGHRGNVLLQLGRSEEALASYGKAIALRPGGASFHYNRGLALFALERIAEALASFEKAIALAPDYAAAFNKRGVVLQQVGRADEALASYGKAIALHPEFAEAFYNRALLLQELGRAADAVDDYNRALGLQPGLADALNNRANALKELGRFGEALASYEAAIAAAPNSADASYNRGVLLFDLKRPLDALTSYERALALKPDFAAARFSRGVCLLALGRMPEGWGDYECRWQLKNYTSRTSVIDAPRWDGEDLGGRSILVYAEQGLGDTIQFARFLPLLRDRGAEVAFLVPENLRRLFSALRSDIRVFSSLAVEQHFDFQCPIMSLPERLKTAPTLVPPPVPLSADPECMAQWGDRFDNGGFKIGIAWQGALWHGASAIVDRSIPLAAFEPLAQIPDVRLISLQKGHGVEQLAQLPAGMTVETLGEDFDSGADAFADTVAVMEHLDLVITCDTSLAHVAGSRGRPVWIGLKHVPEWRWLLEGSDCLWYPSARLFRQKTRGDWPGLMAEMTTELRRRL